MKFTLVIPVAPDRDAEIVESLKDIDYPKSAFHVVVIKGTNPSENRNKGGERAKGEIIGFLDDDAVVDSQLLKKVEEFFNEHKDIDIDIVGGPQLTPHDDKGFAKISGYALTSIFGAWKIVHRYGSKKKVLDADETHLTSANMFVKKKVFDKIKFDPKLFPGEDPKFISDAKKRGFKVAYSPDIKIYHRRRPTIKSFIKQIFNYGKTRPKKETFFETLKMPFFFIPSIFLIYLLGLIIYFSLGFRDLIFSYPLLLYILLNLCFTLYESAKNKDLRGIFVLSFIFPLIHLSYGWGMIYGFFRKIFH